MGTIDTSQFRNGLKVELDGQPFVITYFQHVKPGKGGAFVRTKIKNLLNGRTIERTFRSGEKAELADIEEKTMQYLYNDGSDFHFMNNETFEQLAIGGKVLGDATKFLLDEMIVAVLFFEGQPVNIELPNFVELQIEYTEPGMTP